MKRIATANRQIDEFGAGKDGFAAAVPGVSDATYLSAQFCNSVQESIVRVIEHAGMTPSDDYDQFTNAIVTKTDLSASTGAGLVHTKGPIAGEVDRTIEAITRDIVHVNRFGGNLKTALQQVPEYTTIVLSAGTYDISGLYTSNFNLGAGPFVANMKRGIRLVGAGTPRLNSTGTALEGGTVIQGTLFNLAHDFEVYGLGIDCGKDVLTTKYAGAYAEVFVPGANTSFPTPQPSIKNIKVDRVIALGAIPINGDVNSYKHVMLFENLEGVQIGSVEAIGGFHTFVSKSIDLQADSLTVRGGMSDSINLNANAANHCQQNQFGKINIGSWTENGVEQKAGTITMYPDSTSAPYLTKVKIGCLIARNIQPGVNLFTDSGNSYITDFEIGHLDADLGTSPAAVLRIGYGTTIIRRLIIGTHNIITGGRSFELGPNCTDIDIGSGLQTIIADATIPIMKFDCPRYTHGHIRISLEAAQTAPYIIQRNQGDLDISRIVFSGNFAPNANKLLSSSSGSFTLNATNAAQSGNVAFASASAYYRPYRVQFAGVLGMLVAGAGLTVGTVTPPPLVTMRFPCHVQTAGTALVTRTIEIRSTGVVAMLDTMAVGDLVFLDSISFDPLTR